MTSISNELVNSNGDAHALQLEELDRLVAFSDALSASDIYSRNDLPSYENMHDRPIDSTLSSITDKERLSYTIDAPLLQADEPTDFLRLDTSLSNTDTPSQSPPIPFASPPREPWCPLRLASRATLHPTNPSPQNPPRCPSPPFTLSLLIRPRHPRHSAFTLALRRLPTRLPHFLHLNPNILRPRLLNNHPRPRALRPQHRRARTRARDAAHPPW